MRDDVTVQLVKHSAQDSDVLWAARVSTKGARSLEDINADPEKSAGLINYLMRDRHGSPFEHTSMTFYIEAPIFVFREFHRHRVGWSYSETSGRYRELEPVFYTPPSDPCARSARLAATIRTRYSRAAPGRHRTHPRRGRGSWGKYQKLLDLDIAKEMARTVLPVGTFSSMYATCNARSLMHYLSLRTADERATIPSSPQWEINRVADQLEAHWAQLMPLTHTAYNANWLRSREPTAPVHEFGRHSKVLQKSNSS